VFDKSGAAVYELTAEADHPLCQNGTPVEMAFGGRVLYLRTSDRLFRLSENGESLASAEISRDTLTILPVREDEALVCTPAYAARLETEDFQ
jgi:hypothetical protein